MELKFGCLSEPVGSGSKTGFWFRPEAQRALVFQLESPSIFSSEMGVAQRLHSCRQQLSCAWGQRVLKNSWVSGWGWGELVQ